MWPDLDDDALSLGEERASYGELGLFGAAVGRLAKARAATEASIRSLRSYEASREELRAAAVRFRQERRLQSGEDLRAWLGDRRLTVDDWQGYLHRSLSRDRFGEGSPDAEDGTDPTRDQLDELQAALATDLACDGWWAQMAALTVRYWSAGRLLATEHAEGGVMVAACVGSDGVAGGAVTPADELAFLGVLDRRWCAERLEVLSSRRRALELVTDRYADESLVAARIRDRAADWLSFVFDEIRLPAQPAGNEAVLCARDDGMSAEEIARRAGSELRHHALRRDRLSPDVAAALLGAAPGTVVGPVEDGDGFAVLFLHERRPASAADPEVRTAAAGELLDEALERVSAGQVREVGPL